MRLVIQRVSEAKVQVDSEVVGQIEQGLLVLIAISENDTESNVLALAQKLIKLRIFKDELNKMNLDINQINGKILLVSQFTLYADLKRGSRPSFSHAAKPELAKELYLSFGKALSDLDVAVEYGVFGADMKVSLCNDGPVTLVLDSDT
ncbi:MAG: D-tyrosyl-tRNA(Tyr) deacylase [Oligoflexales bacterium]|nr:D-tyrosyl-tRNA(Tyr) deacylase [Oligoflexales bacterium]